MGLTNAGFRWIFAAKRRRISHVLEQRDRICRIPHFYDFAVAQIPHQKPMRWSDTGFFSEKYRVVAVEAERLIIKGIVTGTVLTIINSDPATPLTAEQYPLGKLIALSDPSASPPH